jgi:hypothetical protein
MSEGPSRQITPSGAGNGVFHDIALRVKLILRLMGDRRVNPLLKLLPLGTLAYLFFPDLVVGPLDDAAVLWLGTYLFVELCPAEIVQEHMRALTSVIDAEFREIDEGDDRPDSSTPLT